MAHIAGQRVRGARPGAARPAGRPRDLVFNTNYQPSFITNVTGGGAMPSWTTNVVTASCAGDGVTDATACLQAAANAARDQGKSLVIPATSAFYKISGAITISTSVGGVGGMPTITQTNQSATWGAQKMFILAPGMTIALACRCFARGRCARPPVHTLSARGRSHVASEEEKRGC